MLEQGVVQELHVERSSARGLVGNIYLGRVARVLPGMQSAFVEIGLERAAFLHIADIWEHRQNGHGGEQKPIEKILHEGQSLLVQVIKDPIGTKGARLSTQVSLAGRLLVFLPQDSHIGISQRIGDEAERETLRERLQHLLPEGLAGGFIIRTMAETASEREMQTDIEYLTKLWGDLNVRSREVPPASLLYQDLNLAQRVLRDMSTEETSRVVVDSRETFGKMQEFARQYTPALSERIKHYVGDRPLFDLHGVEDEIEKALARRVDLKSGGYLIIDQTEAMTTIDVNTGGFVGGRSFDDTIFKTNLEASQVIARQLRMRNLGGIIIIDFIDMENADHRDAVLAELEQGAGEGPHAAHGERLHAAGPGRDDAQAHARVARARAVRDLPDLPGPRRAQDGADDLLRDPARDRARGEAVQRARVPHPRVAVGDRHVPGRGVAEPRAAGRLHRQADFAAGGDAVHAGAVRHRPHLSGRRRGRGSRPPNASRSHVRQTLGPRQGTLRPVFPHEPEPGRFESGSKLSLHGIVGTAPFVLPSREYLVYVPKGRSLWRRAPLLVLCHGCKQTPEEFAQGTRITELADREGFVVLLPRQKDTANPWRCWNWFDTRTMHGDGEAAIVAAQIRSVRRRYRCHRKRVLVAGMSAGGALAAVIGVRFRGLVSAVAVHSGFACGAATSALSAIAVMQRGPEQDVARSATAARAAAPPRALRMPLLAVHGGSDPVVAPRNAAALVRQYLHLNGHPARDARCGLGRLPAADTERARHWRAAAPRSCANGAAMAGWSRAWSRSTGLGHAWSGGDPALAYNDAEAPDATALVGAFFADALS